MDKTSLQYIKNNQLTTIEQPYNAIVKVEPVGLGEYTFNNSAYASNNETTVTKIDNLTFDIDNDPIASLVGKSDKITNFEITVTFDNYEYTKRNDTTINLVKQWIATSLDLDTPDVSVLTCTYNYNGLTDTISVETTGSTYLQCCEYIINEINTNLGVELLKYNPVTTLGTGAVILKITIPYDDIIELNFNDRYLSCKHNYIYSTKDTQEQVVLSVPSNTINTPNIINYSTLNDGAILYLKIKYWYTTSGNISATIVQTTTVI